LDILRIETDKVLKELRNRMDSELGDRLVKIVIFGSRARGDFDDESDTDIAIIVRGLSRELKYQILDTVAEIEMTFVIPLSVIVFSENEFERLKKRERRIALDIEKESIPL
jgi:predicted nucleotidyltransferase